MMFGIPALTTALDDVALRGSPRDVYLWLQKQLDVVHFRPVKLSVAAIALQLGESTVSEAIGCLITTGYLDRGPSIDRVWTYRLVYSNPGRHS